MKKENNAKRATRNISVTLELELIPELDRQTRSNGRTRSGHIAWLLRADVKKLLADNLI